jgi:hypothetical protein
MNKRYVLVVAGKQHLSEVYRMCRKAFSEGIEGHLEIDAEKMKNHIYHLITSPHQFSVIAMAGGKPKAVLLGSVGAHAYCKGLVASDDCIYVSPTLRGSRCADELVEAYTGWCNRIPNLVGATLSLSQLNATTPYMESLYRKHGYKKSGLSYSLMR